MKYVIFLFILFIGVQKAVAQSKPALTSAVYNKWPHIGSFKISPKGNFVLHSVVDLIPGESTLFLTTIKTHRTEKICNTNAALAEFSSNEKYCFVKSGDSVIKIALPDRKKTVSHNVLEHRLLKIGGEEWSVTLSRDGKLSLSNVQAVRELNLDGVDYFEVVEAGVIIRTQIGKRLVYRILNLTSEEVTTVFTTDTIHDFIIDGAKKKIAFFMRTTGCDTRNQPIIRIYSLVDRTLDTIKLNKATMNGMTLSNGYRFSKDGNRIFVELTDSACLRSKTTIPLNIWHYQDVMLQSQQVRQNFNRKYKAVVHLNTCEIILLENENCFADINTSAANDDKWIIVRENNGGDVSEQWSDGNAFKYSLVSTLSGAKLKMPAKGMLSPDCRFYVYFDTKLNHYMSYDILKNITINITKGIHSSWASFRHSNTKQGLPVDFEGWVMNRNSIMLHDEFDIWLVNLSGIASPIQLTRGGEKSIYFETVDCDRGQNFHSGSEILLSGFNLITKENSFYKLRLSGNKPLVKASTAKDAFYYSRRGASGLPPALSVAPLKAKDQEAYLILEMKVNSSPNLIYTRDFKSYMKISDIYPEKKFNWFTSELHSFRSLDGAELQGILYKPENFDPTKKYPIIFHYYETLSDQLNCYIRPVPSSGSLNIAWYVSNGFMVFLPDIHFRIGDPLRSSYASVLGAVNYVKKLDYIDSAKMGLQGHSWGGAQTNYLIARTNVFAAACSASSISNWASAYNSLAAGDHSAQPKFESGQYRVGFTLWDNLGWYINNSAVMSADKIHTPLLLFQTTNDEATRIDQAIELFSSLRRLGRRCWLLEYTEGQHFVSGRCALDFDLRMQQFFNHYLKDEPAPLWMIDGRPANKKDSDDRLQLDRAGRIPVEN